MSTDPESPTGMSYMRDARCDSDKFVIPARGRSPMSGQSERGRARRAGIPVDTGFTYGPLPKPSKASRDALTEKFRAIDRMESLAAVTGPTYLLGGTDG